MAEKLLKLLSAFRKDKMSKVQKLEKTLREASDVYYNTDGHQSLLTDQDFDRLRDQLRELDPNNAFLKEVGAPPTTALSKVKHVIPMGSLDKINAEGDFNTWINTLSKTVPEERERELICSKKLDGVSVELCFRNGKFVQAITRGDGEVGDDVTHTIKNAMGFPRTVDTTTDTYVRCEAIFKLDTWKKHFSDTTANPRNAVAGTVRRTNAVGSEHIMCVAFDVHCDDNDYLTLGDKLQWLAKLCFHVVDSTVVSGCHIREEVPKVLAEMLKTRDEVYETDGMVIAVNSILQQRKLGERDGRPKWAKAWKFPASGGHTELLGVEWSIGSQGVITPVAKVAPVSVGGTTIRNVTLHNADEIERLGVQIGDTVEVIRCGDVIPKIIRVVTPLFSPQNATLVPITLSNCPACGADVKRDGPRMVCSNGDSCRGSAQKRIAKWISKRNIMFLGDSTLEKLEPQSILDLYKLTVDSMIKAGLGKRMSEKILAEIEKSRNVSLSDFLGSLSIDMLGRREASNLVAAGFDTLDTLDKWRDMTFDDLLKLEGFKKTKARRIYEGVKAKWGEIMDLCTELNITTTPKKEKTMSSAIEGCSFCFTGKMEHQRKELEGMVADAGGRVLGVSKNLDYLVIADPNSQSSKARKARDLGTTLISEEDFLEMV